MTTADVAVPVDGDLVLAEQSVDIDSELAKLDTDGYRPPRLPRGQLTPRDPDALP